MNVLLIEDSPADARLLREALLGTGVADICLVHVWSLQEGLDRLKGERFDLVLLDLSLPDSRISDAGFDTLSQAQQGAPETPVVVLTGLEDREFAVQSVQQGAEDYLVKGAVDGHQLTRSIRYAVERGRLRAELRRQAQRAQAGESQLRSLVERNADGIVIVDREGAVRFVNSAGVAMLGRDAEALMGEPFGFPVVAGEAEELDVLQPDGRTLPVEMRVVEVEWEGEAAFLASLRDITERRHLERAHLEEERRRVLIETAGMAAHKINQPLTAILGFSELLLLDAAHDDPRRPNLEAIHQAGQEIREIVRKMQNLQEYVTVAYAGETRIVNLDAEAQKNGPSREG